MCVHHFKRLSVYVKDDNVDSTALGSSPKFHWMIEKGMVGLIGWWGCQSAAWHEFVSFLICGHDKETSYFRSNLRSCGHIGCCTDKMGCFFFSACLGFFNFIFLSTLFLCVALHPACLEELWYHYLLNGFSGSLVFHLFHISGLRHDRFIFSFDLFSISIISVHQSWTILIFLFTKQKSKRRHETHFTTHLINMISSCCKLT